MWAKSNAIKCASRNTGLNNQDLGSAPQDLPPFDADP